MQNRSQIKQKSKIPFLLLFMLLLLYCSYFSTGCDSCITGSWSTGNTGDAVITLVSYNVMNLFDGSVDGTEYNEFNPAASEWNTDAYHARLKALRQVLFEKIPNKPDIIVLQEIEHIGVLEDFKTWYLDAGEFAWTAATQMKDSPIQVGVISRLPITGVASHAVMTGGITAGRPVLELRFRTEKGCLVVLVNHWKSKIGGAEETEPARIASAKLVKSLLQEIEQDSSVDLCIIAGDLNENSDEQLRVAGAYPVALSLSGPVNEYSEAFAAEGLCLSGSKKEVGGNESLLYDFWLDASVEPPLKGSYCFQGDWETIDHILVDKKGCDGRGYDIQSITVLSDAELLTPGGVPKPWSRRSASGYSDHLPLTATFEYLE